MALHSRIDDLLDRRWLTNDGPFVQELERRIADFLGVRHCVTTCNGTTALQIVARAMGLSGEVILPAFTFVATAHALAWQGLTPVFCDVHPVSHNLDPESVKHMIGRRTSAVVGVHVWGRPCEVDALAALARHHGLRLLFDAAHAFACSRDGRMIGGFGDAEVFSFHATKILNTFEGGAIATNDDSLADTARLIRNFGFAGYDDVVTLGTNGKMTEVAAAMGLTSLDHLDDFIEANRINYLAYSRGLTGIAGLTLLDHGEGEGERRNYHHVVLEVDEARAGIARDPLHRVLWAENVLARRYFYPGVHRVEPYRSAMPDACSRLPVTERLAAQTLVLPSGGQTNPVDVAAVCGIVRFAVRHAGEIGERLASEYVG